MFLIFLLWGIISGYFAGFLGIGAGVMIMPFLGIAGIPYMTAVDASLMAVFFSSLTGGIQINRTSRIDWTPCIAIMIPGIFTALIGSIYLIYLIPAVLLQLIFAGLMFLNVDLLRIAEKNADAHIESADEDSHKKNLPYYILIGILSGLMASLLGIGGGLLIVTLLMVLTNISVKDSVKISIIVMIETTFSSLLVDLINNNLPWGIGIPLALGAVMGGFLGTIALTYVSNHVIRNTNYVVSYGLGFLVLIKLALT
ncbi:sulfite exporter TauE/SafE family protein [Legionella sp. W05-934-2]|jgi:uncharacterized membrane protein YfcA|uniref:sulfite exporter TauE/SafE family protein n=1 Tax=Legionella sp. W05-934-2 TaxID=1198649 RepID=UPI0034625466